MHHRSEPEVHYHISVKRVLFPSEVNIFFKVEARQICDIMTLGTWARFQEKYC